MSREVDFDIGDIVYLKTDVDNLPYLVIGIMIRQHGVIYQLSQGSYVSNHYGFEISKEKVIT